MVKISIKVKIDKYLRIDGVLLKRDIYKKDGNACPQFL
jgi:hypothetical protein